MIHFLLALLSNPSRQKCLIDIGTKGMERTEPDPLLFQVPSDYAIVDQEWSGKTAK
jgi:hypothetical protein